MKKAIRTAIECAVFGGLIFTLTVLIFNLYAWRTGGPTLW